MVSDVHANYCTLHWEEPERDGGKPITGYIIERKSGVHWIPMKLKATTNTFEVTYELKSKLEIDIWLNENYFFSESQMLHLKNSF